MKYYIYLNIDDLIVSWEVAIGRIISSREVNIRGGISHWLYSRVKSFANNFGNIYLNREIKLELVRLSKFPNKVSRLSGVFLFDNLNMAKACIKEWDNEDTGKFNKDYISEICFNPSNTSKVDSNWITNCLKNISDDKWMEKYWNGDPYPGDSPKWEIIAEGYGTVLNQQLRMKAYQNIFYKQPYSTPILAAAICAFQYDIFKYKKICHIIPYFKYDNKKNIIYGCFIMENETLINNQKQISFIIDFFQKRNEFPKINFYNNDSFVKILDLTANFFELILDEEVKEYLFLAGIRLENTNKDDNL